MTVETFWPLFHLMVMFLFKFGVAGLLIAQMSSKPRTSLETTQLTALLFLVLSTELPWIK